jgi:hypothetical protein
VNEKVVIVQETEIKINETREPREEYRETATSGALLFCALRELFKVHSFYHSSHTILYTSGHKIDLTLGLQDTE